MAALLRCRPPSPPPSFTPAPTMAIAYRSLSLSLPPVRVASSIWTQMPLVLNLLTPPTTPSVSRRSYCTLPGTCVKCGHLPSRGSRWLGRSWARCKTGGQGGSARPGGWMTTTGGWRRRMTDCAHGPAAHTRHRRVQYAIAGCACIRCTSGVARTRSRQRAPTASSRLMVGLGYFASRTRSLRSARRLDGRACPRLLPAHQSLCVS
jgi:hypothetical protein